MRKAKHPSPANAANSEAINRVLEAEQQAQQAVARCEQQAQEMLHAAQKKVRRIDQRTDERITWMEMRCAQWLSEQSRLLAVGDRAQAAGGTGLPEGVLSGLIDTFAARLTGDDTEAT